MVRVGSVLVAAALMGCAPASPRSFDDVQNGQLQADVERVAGDPAAQTQVRISVLNVQREP
jgi:hypothetical protein